jgi:hypothetical protein
MSSSLYDLSTDALFIVMYYLTGLDICTLAISGDGRMLRRLSQSVTAIQYETGYSRQILPSIFGAFNNLRHLHLGGKLSKSDQAVEFTSLDLSILPSSIESLTLACYNDLSQYTFFASDGFGHFPNLTSLSISYCNKKETFFAHLSSMPLITKLRIEKNVFDYTDMAHMPHTLTDLHIRCAMPSQIGDYSLSHFEPSFVSYPRNLQKLWLEPNCHDDSKVCIIDLSQLPLSLTDITFGSFFRAIFTNHLLRNNNLTRIETYFEHHQLSAFLEKLPICLEEIDIYAESIISDEEVDFSKFTRLRILNVKHLDCAFTIKDSLPCSVTKLSPDLIELVGMKKSSPLLNMMQLDSKSSYSYDGDIWPNYYILKQLSIRRLQAFDHVYFSDFKYVRHLFITGFRYIDRDNTLAELKSLEVFSFDGNNNTWLLDTISVPLKTLKINMDEPMSFGQLDFTKIWAKSLNRLKIECAIRISGSVDDFMGTLPPTLVHLDLDLSVHRGEDKLRNELYDPVTVFPPRLQELTLDAECFDITSIRALPKTIKMLTLWRSKFEPKDIVELPPNLNYISISGRGDFKEADWRHALNSLKTLRRYFYSYPGEMGHMCYNRSDKLQADY